MRNARLALITLVCTFALQSSLAQTPAKDAPKYKSAQEILDAAPPSAWRDLDPQNTLYLELATGRVVIELAPQFAPQHVANIRTLAHAHYFDGLAIIRSQDNFVVQWGDPNSGEKNEKPIAPAQAKLPAEFTINARGLDFHRLPDSDGYASQVGFVDGFPAARDPSDGQAWLTHCYGVLGAGRGTEADSSNGSEIYVVTGQSPRQLDRNITTIGRVVQGIELLSVLPRGTGALGFYEKPEQRVPIKSIRLAADVPESERAHLQVIRTDTPTWDAVVEARRNRRDEWYKRPAGHIDLCNIPISARAVPAPAAAPAAAPTH
jgi:peptidylprolyl isomerase